MCSAPSSASSTQVSGLVTQYNTLRTQVGGLAKDSSYQGLNLLNGSGQTLTVSFSTLTASNLRVNSVDVTAGARGLAIAQVATATQTNSAGHIVNGSGFQLSWNSHIGGKALNSAGSISANTFYFSGTGTQFNKTATIHFAYGSVVLTITIGSAGNLGTTFTTTQIFSDGEQLKLKTSTVAGLIQTGNAVSLGTGAVSAIKFKTVTGEFVLNSALPNTTQKLLDELQNNLETLRAQAENIGSNVALLNTRLDFTNSYVNLLTQGGGKLTLADLNEEGANLLSLQTRQQLGIQALSFAGQNEKAVLSLFR